MERRGKVGATVSSIRSHTFPIKYGILQLENTAYIYLTFFGIKIELIRLSDFIK